MNSTEIVPGCHHFQEDKKSALFGSPPEILKFILKAGKPVPPVGVLPDISYVNGVSQIALEFPSYWFMFFEKNDGVDHRFRVLGTKEMCKRLEEILAVTLLGPSPAMMKKWKISKSRIDTLTKMMNHMALKREGKRLEIEDLFEFVHFSDDPKEGVPLFRDDDLLVWRKGGNRFEVGRGNKRESIDLNFTGNQLPLLAEPTDELEIPQVLRVKLLGSFSGFDAAGPTTGMVLWVNCNGFLVDGPVGTSAYLRRLGIPKSDLRGVILSHVHDDHCTLMDMILSEQTANIITTREIYESMLIKVAGVLGEPIDQIRHYLTFTEVIPGKPIKMYGAVWEFFYTVHSIPTIGFRVSVPGPDGKEHTIVHSSDTINFAGLEEMAQAGAISNAHEKRMKELVRGGERLVMLDAGGPPIHGVPADFDPAVAANPDAEFLYCHINPEKIDDPKREVAVPGWSRTYLKGKDFPQSLVLNLLKTLRLLEVSDEAWINVLLSQGQILEVGPGEEIVSQGKMGDSFYFVLAGSQQVLDSAEGAPQLLAVLEGGDFFGEMSIIRDTERNASVRTLSPSILFKLPGDLFLEFVEANGLKETFERLWLSRSIISKVMIFRNLHPHAKHQISLMGTPCTYEEGQSVIRQGGKSDDFYIITRGRAEVARNTGKGREETKSVLKRGDFFGENVAMGYRDRRNASVKVLSKKLEVLKFAGKDLRRLAESIPVLCHELHLVMRERGMTNIPANVRESGEF